MSGFSISSIVSYHPSADDGLATIGGAPLVAIVSSEVDAQTVNLMVIDINGNPQSRTGIATADAGNGAAFIS
jgi:hypothetical protein